jgi:hypothetical protein
MGENMKKISKTKHSLKLITAGISLILIFSTIGLTNGIETNNIVDIIDSSRGTTYLSIVPATQTVGYDETFSIIVHLDPGEPVIGVQIDLSFNASLVQAVSVANANTTVWNFFQAGTINNILGTITMAGVAIMGGNVSVPIDCFNITFTAQSISGTSALNLQNVAVVNVSVQPVSSLIITNGQVTVSSIVNIPPIFGTPSPTNGSTGQPLSLSWSIPINDPEGDLFSWSIQCSNGQSNSGTGASNGTKSLSLSGLAYSTTYTVWVNATDPSGSGQYTRSWFSFTTKANLRPEFGTPSPTNGSTGQPLSLSWSIPINDPEGDLFSWTIQCSNGQTNSGSSASNGTKSLAISGLAYLTTYTVWVNATDPSGSGQYNRSWFTFTTKASLPPILGTPTPANGSTNQPTSFTWSIPINDPEGDLFSWSITCSNGQSNSGSSASNGTKSLALSGLAFSTTYTVWVNATDPTGSGQTTSGYYTFTTESNDPPQITSPNPVNQTTGIPISTTTLTIYISDPDGDTFSWSIQTSPNVGSNSGSSSSNGTKTCTISGLQYNTTYYWFVNATDPSGSGVTTYKWYYFTTETHINDPPSFSNEIPPDESANVPLSTSILSVDISDPEGDNIDWTIQTIPNVGSSSGTGQPSGTKTCTISGLTYNTTYTWIVSAIDPSGSGEWTTETYIFTTENKPIPDLMCYGDLTWLNVKKGSTVQDSFTLENIGEPNSELDWKIESWPDWGVWTFNPSSGENLKPSDGNVTIQVTVVAPNARIRPRTIQNPDGKLSSYQGYVKVVNKESSNDYYNIPVLLTTPRTKTNPNLFLITFLQKLIDRFPMLEKYLQFFPIFNLILKLST